MTRLSKLLGGLCAAVTLALALAIAAPVSAQGVNPQAAGVKEEQLLQQLQTVQGRISIPDSKAATLIQPAGKEWRDFHRTVLPWVGGIAIVGMLAVLVVFYLTRGKIRIDAGPAGRTILRFGGVERFIHWMTAFSFIALALSGLNVSFGRALLLPLVGPEAFHVFSSMAKLAHNYLGIPFAVGVVLMFLAWVKDNIPSVRDVEWIKSAGGLFGHSHPPAGRFNAGQKGIFWAVVLGGAALTASGLILLFPFYVTDIAGMQTAQMVHALIAIVLVAIIIAHIYIGSVGMEGAFDAMGSGEVDLNWAKEHHSLWVEEQLSGKAKAAPGATAVPAE